mgnify:CR=1 FL=1
MHVVRRWCTTGLILLVGNLCHATSPVTANPQGLVTLLVPIQNTTERTTHVTVNVDVPPDWVMLVPFSATRLPAGARLVQPVILRAGSHVPAGSHEITATTFVNGDRSERQHFLVDVPRRPSLSIDVDPPPALLTSVETRIRVHVTNTGNVQDGVTITVAGGVASATRNFDLAPGEMQTVDVEVQVAAPRGVLHEETLTIEAHSRYGVSAKTKTTLKVLLPGSPLPPTLPATLRLQAATRDGFTLTGSIQGGGPITEDGHHQLGFRVTKEDDEPGKASLKYTAPAWGVTAGHQTLEVHRDLADFDGYGFAVTFEPPRDAWPSVRSVAYLAQSERATTTGASDRAPHAGMGIRAAWPSGLRADVAWQCVGAQPEALARLAGDLAMLSNAWTSAWKVAVRSGSAVTWSTSIEGAREEMNARVAAWWRPTEPSGSLEAHLRISVPSEWTVPLGARTTSSLAVTARREWGVDSSDPVGPDAAVERATRQNLRVSWDATTPTTQLGIAIERSRLDPEGTHVSTETTDVDVRVRHRPETESDQRSRVIITTMGWSTTQPDDPMWRAGVRVNRTDGDFVTAASLDVVGAPRPTRLQELRAQFQGSRVTKAWRFDGDLGAALEEGEWTVEMTGTWSGTRGAAPTLQAYARFNRDGEDAPRRHVLLHAASAWPLPSPWQGWVTADFVLDAPSDQSWFTAEPGDSLLVIHASASRDVTWRDRWVGLRLDAHVARHLDTPRSGITLSGEASWQDGAAVGVGVDVVGRGVAEPASWGVSGSITRPFTLPLPERVRRGQVTGRILDEDGEPWAGLVVNVGGVATRTAGDGTFTLEGVPVGGHVLSFPLAGREADMLFEPADGKVVQVTTDAPVHLDVLAAWPGDVSAQVVIDQAGRSIAGAPQDAVMIAKDVPLAGWQVTLQRGTVRRMGVSDAAGYVTFTRLLPGRWFVTVDAPAGLEADQVEVGDVPPFVTVESGGEVHFGLPVAPRVQEVRVTEGGSLRVP